MLNGKTALVTGGSRGIGAAIAIKLAFAIVYAGNNDQAELTRKNCETHGVKAVKYACDVSDFAAVKTTVAAIKAEFGGVYILINNAGITRDGLVALMKEDDFDQVISVNLKGAFNLIRHVSPLMIRAGGGRIVNISSISGLMGNAGQVNYAASKAGLVGMTKSTARELAAKAVTCNAIAPGFIKTDMTKSFEGDDRLTAAIPLGHMGTPDDVAELAAFLCSPAAGYITGEVIRVDGGMAM